MGRTSESGTASGRITLSGAVSMGTGVMIGAGVFALMGQVAQAGGQVVPGGVPGGGRRGRGTTAYSYVKLSNTFPSAGGIGMFLTEAYGVGPIAATFTMAMWASMILNESLVARTFGTYFTKMVGTSTATRCWSSGSGWCCCSVRSRSMLPGTGRSTPSRT